MFLKDTMGDGMSGQLVLESSLNQSANAPTMNDGYAVEDQIKTIKSNLRVSTSTDVQPAVVSNSISRGNPKEISHSNSTQKNGHHRTPFFYFSKNGLDSTSNFSLRSQARIDDGVPGLYNNYGTTLAIITILHVIYFYQWNKRYPRREVSTSYDQLVNKKQFYKVAYALMSHPPVDGGERDSRDTPLNWANRTGESHIESNSGRVGGLSSQDSNGYGGPDASTNSSLLSNMCQIYRRVSQPIRMVGKKILRPALFGSLSGLPLLLFVSHVLWQCRALEELYDEYDGKLNLALSEKSYLTELAGLNLGTIVQDDNAGNSSNSKHYRNSEKFTYFRVLVALTSTSILLELNIIRFVLKRAALLVDLDGLALSGPNSLFQILSQRAICSLASLAAAVLMVYNSQFPYAPPPVFPFLRFPYLSSSGFGICFSIVILTALCHRIHPISSVVSGMLSGILWSLGTTTFLGSKYWGNVMVFVLLLAFLFSLKASSSYSSYLGKFLPCLDYVAWDENGNIDERTAFFPSNQPRRTSSRVVGDSNDNDLEMGSSGLSTERIPLFSRSNSSSSGGSVIRGRLPLMNTMDSDLSESEVSQIAASTSRYGSGLSRRVGAQ